MPGGYLRPNFKIIVKDTFYQISHIPDIIQTGPKS